jgi:hypothetical protein
MGKLFNYSYSEVSSGVLKTKGGTVSYVYHICYGKNILVNSVLSSHVVFRYIAWKMTNEEKAKCLSIELLVKSSCRPSDLWDGHIVNNAYGSY